MLERLKLTIFIIFLLSATVSNAQYNCLFDHYSTLDGLSHGSVSCMLRDSKGFMWFGTWDGINRFDGKLFKSYSIKPSLNSNNSSQRVESIIEDGCGAIWMRTYDAKVFRLNAETELFETILSDHNFDDNVQVSSLFAATNGDVWLPTRHSGIYRVVSNSNKITDVIHYHTGGKMALPDNNIDFVQEDSQKNIWVNTAKGLICLVADSVDGTFIQKTFSQSVENEICRNRFSSLYSAKGLLYLGTKNGSVFQLNLVEDRLKEIKLSTNKPISQLISSGDSLVFIGTLGDGIFVYDTDLDSVVSHYQHKKIETVYKLFPDSHGILWIESSVLGFSKVDIKTGVFKHFEQQLDLIPDVRQGAQCGFIEDHDHTIWLTLKGGGFGYYNRADDTIDYFYNNPSDDNSKLSNYVYCFYKDTTNVLWLSTYFKGLEKVTFLNSRFKFFQPSPKSINSIANEVRAMMYDSKGRLWVATKRQHIFLLDSNKNVLKEYTSFNNKPIGLIYALQESSNGDVFVGTKGNGLFIIENGGDKSGSIDHYMVNAADENSISSNNIYSFLEDKSGRMWIGTYGGGVNLFENGKFYNSFNYFSNYPVSIGKKVRHLALDKHQNIWLATTDGILFLNPNVTDLSKINFKHFSKKPNAEKSLSSNDIYWVFPDNQDSIWFATLGGGLNKLCRYPDGKQPLQFDVFTKKDGLPSDVIFTIIGDDENNLWMSTENGITLYDRATRTFHNYNKYDGILKGGFSEGTAVISVSGEIAFGANNGFYSFDPKSLVPRQKCVNLLFTTLQIYSQNPSTKTESITQKPITQTRGIQLKYNQNVITINWAALDFSMQEKFNYAYTLDGFDGAWYHVENQNSVTYNKLPPGNYTFKIKFDNPELQLFNKTNTFNIEILPPFWKTTYAYMVYILLLTLLFIVIRRIVITIIRLRHKVIIEKELTDIKLNFFTNISHELRTPLTLILGPAKELADSENLSAKGRVYITLIEDNAKRMLRLVNQLLDFRKVQNSKMMLTLNEVDMVIFIKMKCRNFEELATEKQIDFVVSTTVDSAKLWIDEEKMDSIIYNLLSNAFKFTPPNGSVEVKLSDTKNHALFIEVIDSGIGIAKEREGDIFTNFVSNLSARKMGQSGTGIGLALSKELVALHKGHIEYRKTANGGATFAVTLFKGTAHFNNSNVRFLELSKEIDDSLAEDDSQEMATEHVQKPPLLLIVEDNKEVRQFLMLQLNESFRIDEAENGIVALQKVKACQPDIILTDVMMPEMDGIAFLDAIKSNFETSHIPVVLLSAKSSVESKIEGLRYGADAYIVKPFNTLQLKMQLDNLLQQRTVLKERYTNNNLLHTDRPSFSLTEKDEHFLMSVREIIEDNLANVEFKIENIYKELGIGRTKFFLKMKGLTGLSPIDFVKEYRIIKALTLLKSERYNITEVSYMAGYSDSGYFSKCFKERFGVLPSHYRKM